MLEAYRQHVSERAALGIPPLPLNAKQVAEVIEQINQKRTFACGRIFDQFNDFGHLLCI